MRADLSRESMVFTLLWKPTVRRNSKRLRSLSQFRLFWILGGVIGAPEGDNRRSAYSNARVKN